MNDRIKKFLITLVPIFIFSFLLWVDMAPGGVSEHTLYMDGVSPYINTILPDDRVSDVQNTKEGDSFVTIFNDPTYFNVLLPNTDYQNIEVELFFNSNNQNIIELGALANVEAEAYDLKPILNTIIDELDWVEIEGGNLRLLQRNKNYDSLEEFFDNLPDRTSIGVYAYDLEEPFRLSSYEPSSDWNITKVSLRGYHKYLTYIKDETFTLDARFMDMNRTSGQDEVVVRVWNEEDEVVYEHTVKDDGNILDNEISTEDSFSIKVPNLYEGVYSVEISGTSDIFWRELSTTQRYMTFVSKIYIGDDVGYLDSPRATSFYTDAKNLTLQTTHAQGTQSLRLGSQTVGVGQSHEKYNYTINDSGLANCYTPVGDIKITGDGKFSFSKDAYFNPDPVSLNAYNSIDALDIDYILTTYKEPTSEDGWFVASSIFSIDELEHMDNKAIKFTISTPNISYTQGSVDINAIKVRFIKDPMTFIDFIKAIRERMPFGI